MIRYPRIQTVYDDSTHPKIRVTMVEEGPPEEWETQLYCGYSWCRGDCNYPALVLTGDSHPQRKVMSSMVAHGPLVQEWRVEWKGQKQELPAALHEDFEKRWWL